MVLNVMIKLSSSKDFSTFLVGTALNGGELLLLLTFPLLLLLLLCEL